MTTASCASRYLCHAKSMDGCAVETSIDTGGSAASLAHASPTCGRRHRLSEKLSPSVGGAGYSSDCTSKTETRTPADDNAEDAVQQVRKGGEFG